MHARLPQIRYIALVTTLLYLVYTVIEYQIVPNYDIERFLCHAVLVPVTMAIVGILTHFPQYHRAMSLLLILAPIGANCVNVYLNINSGNFSDFAPELYLSIMWIFAISGLRLAHALISATSSCIIILVSSFQADLPSPFLSWHVMWLFSAFSFGFVSALVLERTHYSLYEKTLELAALASRDPLTQLWNREKMSQLFEQERQLATTHKQPISLIMLDIDHFKAVNDEFGHDAGDKVLSHFAQLLKRNVRQQDHVGRFGGEEFFIILPSTIGTDALNVAQQLQQQINQYQFPVVGHKSASIGVTQAQNVHESLTQLMRRADIALYQAKAQGRDNVVYLAATLASA
ncbi:diguanylate cyclase [Shewanella sp.]|uniref:diguanylate cyclase n=1 Tax=Shewanella sp. TaxID=50422 RepID=UPI003A96BE78